MSLPTRQLFKNATLTVFQVVVSAAVMFAVYKFLLGSIGAEQIGIWSIVMAVSAVTRMVDLGFAGGMTRFVAKYRALEQPAAVIEVIETAFVSLVVFSGLIVAVAYPLLTHFLPILMDSSSANIAMGLVPYSLVSFSLVAAAGVLLSTLDGLVRTDLRNLTLIAGSIVFGILVPVLVTQFGLVGLGMAQLLQSACVLAIAGWLVCRRIEIRFFRPRWSQLRFKEMLAYNANLQVTSVAAFLGDPLTKVMIGHYGNLELVGYFEMATKLVGQFRAIATNVTQIIVPVVTQLHETGSSGLQKLYRDSYRSLFYVCSVFYAGAVLLIPLISEAWIGYFHVFFVATSYIMILAMFLNTLSGPAYFFNLGTGQAGENTIAHLIIGAANCAMGIVFGSAFGGGGVSLSYALAIIIGSAFLVIRFFRAHHLPIKYLFPESGAFQLFAVILIAFSGAALSFAVQTRVEFAGLAVVLGALLLIFGWQNPERLHLFEMLRRGASPQKEQGEAAVVK